MESMNSLLQLLLLHGAAQQIVAMFPDGRIIGGENALITKFPYHVSLEYLGHHVCSGSILSQNYVITAAHCVPSTPLDYTVRAGSSLRGRGGSVHHVAKVIRHQKYAIKAKEVPINDLAILDVKEAFVFDDSRQPIALFQDGSNPGVTAIITGWGNTAKGFPPQLQTLSIPIFARDLCDELYEGYGGVPAGQICAAYYGVGAKGACQGDSGGPLVIDARLAGIVSWGNGCAEAYYPGVYTEVSHFREWITEHAETITY